MRDVPEMSCVVASRSFSSNSYLVDSLASLNIKLKLNTEGLLFDDSTFVDFAFGYDAAIVGLENLNKKVIDALPHLKIVSKYGVGLDAIDQDYLREKNIDFFHQPGVNSRGVAEQIIGCMLLLAHRTMEGNRIIERGGWRQIRGADMSGKTVGIIGLGNVGSQIVKMLRPFNCTVLAFDRIQRADAIAEGVSYSDLTSVLRMSDFVSVNLPLTDETRNLLNRSALACLRKGAYFVNFARGGLVDQRFLLELFESGHLGGIALDVFEVEPPKFRSLKSGNYILSPHLGGSSEESVRAMGLSAIEGIRLGLEKWFG